MNILITGASGLIGTAMTNHFREKGENVYKMARQKDQEEPFYWLPDQGVIHFDESIDIDVVINLAGYGLDKKRWTPKIKQKILNSRVQSTQLLADKLVQLKYKPKLLISASATGYYGNTGDEILDEKGGRGAGFLAQVCDQWEKAAKTMENAGIRLVKLRLGVVLSKSGGMLKKVLPVFKMGLGAKLGNGRQYISWIGINDLCRIISFIIDHEELKGPVNAVSPNPVTNKTFTNVLGNLLNRPTLLTIPAFMLRTLYGEMAGEMILNSTRVIPAKLQEAVYPFANPTIKEAIETQIKGN